MSESLELYCPYCGESVALYIDEDGSSRQAYVEDCPVCCRPWNVEIMQNRDGTWTADLRTEDD